MEFKECLLNRRSIRYFTDETISEETIREIVNAAIYAPSACNFAAWKYILFKSDTPNREAIKNTIALKAPYGFLVCYRNDMDVTGRVRYDYIQSAAASVQNMLLYINSIGLGACWICDLPDDKEMKKAYSIPANFDIVCYVAFGHPVVNNEASEYEMKYHYGDVKSFKERKRRYSIDQVLCNDTFRVVANDVTFAKYPTFAGGGRKLLGKLDRLYKKLKNYKWRHPD